MGEVALSLCRGYQARVGRELRRAVFGASLRAIFFGTMLSCLEADSTAALQSGPLDVPSVHASELTRGPRGHRQIALTFDAGGDADGFPELLAELDRSHRPATFFVTAQWVQRYPAYAKMLVLRANPVGNHSWNHRDLTRLSNDEIRHDILRSRAFLSRWFGPPARLLFRCPYGASNPRVMRILSELEYHPISWTVDSLDSIEPRKTAHFIEKRITAMPDEKLDGAIILMHVGYPETVAAVPRVIAALRQRHFEFITILQWIADTPNSEQHDRPRFAR